MGLTLNQLEIPLYTGIFQTFPSSPLQRVWGSIAPRPPWKQEQG